MASWSKKIAIQHIVELKSPFETEQQPVNLIDKLRMAAQKVKGKMGIPQREM